MLKRFGERKYFISILKRKKIIKKTIKVQLPLLFNRKKNQITETF